MNKFKEIIVCDTKNGCKETSSVTNGATDPATSITTSAASGINRSSDVYMYANCIFDVLFIGVSFWI